MRTPKEKKDAALESDRRRYWRNREKRLALSKKYYFDKKENRREARREICKKWARKNSAKVNAWGAQYRAIRTNQKPAWANDTAMLCYYEFAALKSKITGQKYEVDHIVPLQSDIVCGLHTDFNMQVLDRSKNKTKSNRFWPDMP